MGGVRLAAAAATLAAAAAGSLWLRLHSCSSFSACCHVLSCLDSASATYTRIIIA